MYRTYREIRSAQWWDRDRIREVQEEKLKRLVRHAYQNVAYYRTTFDSLGLRREDVQHLEDLQHLPLTSKRDLQKVPVEELLDRHQSPAGLYRELSGGSTGTPFVTYYDAAFRKVRNSRFLRALVTAGYRLGHRMLLVTSRTANIRYRRILGWSYASYSEPADEVMERFIRHRPRFLYGYVTALRLLAQELDCIPPAKRQLAAVLTTAETLDPATRVLLESTFGCRVFNLYGLSEMGLVGWECEEHRGFHLAEEGILVEPVPISEGQDGHRLVFTNLDSEAMPFIRFDTKDLGVFGRPQPCACGRTTTVLKRVDGRVYDCIHLANGRRLSPYALTDAIIRVVGVQRFRVLQRAVGEILIELESSDEQQDAAPQAVRTAVKATVGAGTDVQVVTDRQLLPMPGRKFRIVESHVVDKDVRAYSLR